MEEAESCVWSHAPTNDGGRSYMFAENGATDQDRLQDYGCSARYKKDIKEEEDRCEDEEGEETTCPPVPPQGVVSTGKRRLKLKNHKCCC